MIAGGGLAGAAAASILAKAGIDVRLIEREAGPSHKICGEFLSIEAQTYLAKLGLDLAPLGGHRISKIRLVRGDKRVETALPFEAMGLSRHVLDEALLRHAGACGAEISRGQRINNISTADGIALETASLGVIRPRTLFLATGKHELRGLRRDTKKPNRLVGFKMYFRLSPQATQDLSGHVTLYMFAGGYAGLQLVEDGQANLCLLIEKGELADAGGAWPALLERLCRISPHLNAALAGATPLLGQPLSIYRVPYGYIHRATPADHAQLFRLGDQAGVIPSFTGDGMAIALHSAALAAAIFLRGGTAAVYHRQLERDLKGQIGRASRIYRLSKARPAQLILFEIARLFPALLSMGASMTRVGTDRLILH